MTYALPPLAWLRTFEAAARHLGFARAAEELGMTSAAVSQQMRALEQRLGFALFERLPRGVRLTTMGRAYLPAVRRALDELSTATSGLFGRAGRRPLTVRCVVSYAALALGPRLAAFRAAHPTVALRLCADIWGDSIDDGEVDLEIRYGDGRWSGFAAAPLSEPVSLAVCPPDSRFGDDPAADLRCLSEGRRIHIMGCENLWTRLASRLGWPETEGDGLTVDTSLVALEMVAAGAGCALISGELARPLIAAGRVTAAPGVALEHDQAHYALTPLRSVAPSPEALLFRDWLLAGRAA